MTQEQIIEAVEKMTVLEINALVKTIEEKWGVQRVFINSFQPVRKKRFDVKNFGHSVEA